MGAFLSSLLGTIGEHGLKEQADSRKKKETDLKIQMDALLGVLQDDSGKYTDEQKKQAAAKYSEDSGILKNKHYGGFVQKILGGMTGNKQEQKPNPDKDLGSIFSVTGSTERKNKEAETAEALKVKGAGDSAQAAALGSSRGKVAGVTEAGGTKEQGLSTLLPHVPTTLFSPARSAKVDGKPTTVIENKQTGEFIDTSTGEPIPKGASVILTGVSPQTNKPVQSALVNGKDTTIEQRADGQLIDMSTQQPIPAGASIQLTNKPIAGSTSTTSKKDAFGNVESSTVTKKPLLPSGPTGAIPGSSTKPTQQNQIKPFDPANPPWDSKGQIIANPAGFQFESLPEITRAQASKLGIKSGKDLAKEVAKSIDPKMDTYLAAAQEYMLAVQSGGRPDQAIDRIGKGYFGKTGHGVLGKFLKDEGILSFQGSTPVAQVRNSADQADLMLSIMPRLRELTKELGGEIGPIGGRLNEGLLKLGTLPNPKFAEYRDLLALYKTGLMKMHFGARGGLGLSAEFNEMWNPNMNSDSINSALNAGERLAKEVRDKAKAGMYIDPKDGHVRQIQSSTGAVPGTGLVLPPLK